MQFAKKIKSRHAESTIAASGDFPEKENRPTRAKSLVPIPAMEIGKRAIKPAVAITQERKTKLYFSPVALKRRYAWKK